MPYDAKNPRAYEHVARECVPCAAPQQPFYRVKRSSDPLRCTVCEQPERGSFGDERAPYAAPAVQTQPMRCQRCGHTHDLTAPGGDVLVCEDRDACNVRVASGDPKRTRDRAQCLELENAQLRADVAWWKAAALEAVGALKVSVASHQRSHAVMKKLAERLGML